MRLHADCDQYLGGEAFSSSYLVQFVCCEADRKYRSRYDVLQAIARGKKIIHVGCVDHSIKQISVKLKHNQWVHKLLADVAERCVGVDVLSDCVEYIRDTLGYDEIYAGDILTDDLPFIDAAHWDYIFLPEVLEHIDNPVDFLTRLRKRFETVNPRLVVSVPNAYSRVNASYATKGQELINSDHRYVFTPYTLAKIAHIAGFQIENITMCGYGRISRRRVYRNWMLRRYPLQRDDIVMTLRPVRPRF